jgi:hypothetical protein
VDSLAWSIAKIIVGLGVIGIILWKLPIVEIFYVFLVVVIVPISFMIAMGWVSSGIWDILKSGVPEFRRRVEEKRVKIKEEELKKRESAEV